MTVCWAVAGAAMMAWIVLLLARGGFWRVRPRVVATASRVEGPAVVAVIPARNEADVVAETLPTVLSQAYEGRCRVRWIDDRSDDGTAARAREAASEMGGGERLQVVAGSPRPDGWSGKLWALHQGTRDIEDAEFLWLTDADIAHAPWVLGALVDRAEAEGRDLVSVMAKLRVDSWWDRLLIPAFVYFFAKLYPFRFVADPGRSTAGAAGGCVLVRREILQRAGGVAAIRSALIDDCALARLLQEAGGRLWLGFSDGVRSVRGYGRLCNIWDMVARSAYTQLHRSPLLLLGTVAGMAFLYALPPVATLGGALAAVLGIDGAIPLTAMGGATWTAMAGSFVPILRHHGVGLWFALLLPLAGAMYTAMTISSAWRHARGRGGAWKGRVV